MNNFCVHQKPGFLKKPGFSVNQNWQKFIYTDLKVQKIFFLA